MNSYAKQRVKRVIDFIQLLRVPSGKGQGKPLKLRPFQRKFIEDIYGNIEGKTRRTRRAVLSIARKNGKTTIIAALALVHLVGPEAEPNGEIYSAANDKEQAAIIFKYARQLIELNPELSELCEVIPSTKTITCRALGSVYQAISREANTKMGFNPSMVIYDELSQSKHRDLFDALDTSMGAREEPLLVIISTQSNDPEHVLSQIIDDGLRAKDPTTVVHLYEVPEDADIYDEKNWALANPALGDFRSRADMRAMANRAKRMPSFESSFRNLYLNQRVDAKSPLISRTQWMACHKANAQIDFGSRIYLSLDLSSTTDLSALTAIAADTEEDTLMQWFWKPEDLVEIHSKRDQTPYEEWARAGWLTLTPGRSIDLGAIAGTIVELCQDYTVVGLTYDRWRIDWLLKELDRVGLRCWVEGKDTKPEDDEQVLRLVPWGQGFKDMGPAVDALEKSVVDRRLAHNNNPLLNFCMANAIAVQDPAGNRKLDKSKTRFRIDGAVSVTMGLGIKNREREIVEEEPAYQMIVV